MEYIAPSIIFAFVFAIFLSIIFKFSSESLIKLFDGEKVVLLITFFMFVLLCSIYSFKEQEWIADLLKVVVGIVVGFAAAKGNKLFGKSGVDASGATLGDNAKLAGRDINEMIENMHGSIEQMKDSVVNQYSQISNSINSQDLIPNMVSEYLFFSFFSSDGEPINEIAKATRALQLKEWNFVTFSNFYDGKHGFTALYHKTRKPNDSDQKTNEGHYRVRFYYGIDQLELDY